MFRINILTRYERRLFDQHLDLARLEDRVSIVENSDEHTAWDCVVVFDGLPAERRVRVAEGGLLFVAGEPPDAMTYTQQFLGQFDRSYCAHTGALGRPDNRPDQYFNNWHFGYEPSQNSFRYTFEQLRDMVPPAKTKDMSVIMSSLAYMPNHLKRLQFLQQLQARFGDRVDVYGRGHRFIPYKDEALLPYRFHICVENCVVPDLWTEKLADPLLGFAVPVYAGCPNLARYIPAQAFVRIDMDDIPGSLAVLESLLASPEQAYERHRAAVLEARARLLSAHNLVHLLADFVASRAGLSLQTGVRTLLPNEQTRSYGLQNALLRGRRLVYRKYFEWSNRGRLARAAR